MTTIKNFHDLFNNLKEWVANHGDNADHTAFIKACDEIMYCTCEEYYFRTLPFMIGKGCITLDYALSIIGEHVPVNLYSLNLPGCAEYRAAYEIYDED